MKTRQVNNIEIIDFVSNNEYNEEKIKSFCEKTLNKLSITNWDFTLAFCDNDYISNLNEKYRKKKEPTDVLTFCEVDTDNNWVDIKEKNENMYAGDIIISIPFLKENAKKFSVKEDEELKRLIIHGVLHLYGMDHKTNEPSEEMLKMQEEILEYFGEIRF